MPARFTPAGRSAHQDGVIDHVGKRTEAGNLDVQVFGQAFKVARGSDIITKKGNHKVAERRISCPRRAENLTQSTAA